MAKLKYCVICKVFVMRMKQHIITKKHLNGGIYPAKKKEPIVKNRKKRCYKTEYRNRDYYKHKEIQTIWRVKKMKKVSLHTGVNNKLLKSLKMERYNELCKQRWQEYLKKHPELQQEKDETIEDIDEEIVDE